MLLGSQLSISQTLSRSFVGLVRVGATERKLPAPFWLTKDPPDRYAESAGRVHMPVAFVSDWPGLNPRVRHIYTHHIARFC